MGTELDLIIAIFSIGAGILMLAGQTDLFFSNKRDPGKYADYDVKKFSKPCGIVFLLIGGLTLADSFIKNMYFSIAYLLLVIILFSWLFWFYNKKCRKS